MSKRALITGITGQDGYYLSKLLLEKGYEVHGIKRRSSSFNTQRVDLLYHDMHEEGLPFYLHFGDVTDALSITRLIKKIQPDEIYHLAAQSHVRTSFDIPEYTADTNAMGSLHILEAIHCLGMGADIRYYQASSSEMYGKVAEVPQTETTPFYPRSPYAASKVFGYWIAINYREAYNMFASNGILFNHESPQRGETFVTRKITRGVAMIKAGKQKKIFLGNLDAKRDWGHSRDYVYGMWLMLQHHKADDFVLATGRAETVRYFLEQSFRCVNVDVEWEGEGLHEIGYNKKTREEIVAIDERYFRPTEVDLLLGDSTKARNDLRWEPVTTLESLIEEMVSADLDALGQE